MAKIKIKATKKEAIELIAMGALASTIILIVLVIIDFSTDKFDINSPKIITNENVQFQLRQNEVKFRDSLVAESSYLPKNFQTLSDSLLKNENERNIIKEYFVFNNLKNGLTNYHFYVNVGIRSQMSYVMIVDKIEAEYSIDFNKLQEIIDSSKEKMLTPDILKFGNYLKLDYHFKKTFDTVAVAIAIFILVAAWSIFIYLKRAEFKVKKNHILVTSENIANDKSTLSKVIKDVGQGTVSKENFDIIKSQIESINKNLDSYSIDKILYSVLLKEVDKSEEKSADLFRRSTLMLILGLLVAIVGVVVFCLLLPHFDNSMDAKKYLAITVRPTLLLVFVQSIAFFLLRQYRSLITDYKYFYKEYVINFQLLSIYQLLQKGSLNDNEIKFIEFLESVVLKYYDSKTENSQDGKKKK